MKTAGQTHDPASTIAAARLAVGLILPGIPRVHHLPCFGVDRQAISVPLGRCEHAIAPVVGDERYPIAGDVVWRLRAASYGCRRTGSPSTCALTLSRGRWLPLRMSERGDQYENGGNRHSCGGSWFLDPRGNAESKEQDPAYAAEQDPAYVSIRRERSERHPTSLA